MTIATPDANAIAPFDVTALEDLGIPELPAEREELRRPCWTPSRAYGPYWKPTLKPTTRPRPWSGRRWKRCIARGCCR